jgi:translocation and assembly module TamB
MMKTFWRSGLVALLLVIIFVIFLLTPSGLRAGLSIGKLFIPGELHYKNASGLITGPIQLSGIDYRYKNHEIRIQSLKFNWSFWALLRKKVMLQDLTAKGVNITQACHPEYRRGIPSNKLDVYDWRSLGCTRDDGPTHTPDFNSLYQRNPFQNYTEQANAIAQHYKQLLQNFTLSWGISVKNARLGPIIYYSPANNRLLELTYLNIDGGLTKNKNNLSLESEMSFPYAIKFSSHVTGNSADYQFNFAAAGKHLDFKINGEGNSQELALSTTKTLVLNGLLKGNLHLNWQKDLTWDTDFTAQGVNFSLLYPTWPSHLMANIQSQGDLAPKNPSFSLQAKIKTAISAIDLNLRHTDSWGVNWSIALAKHKIESTGTLSGSFQNPLTSGTLKIQEAAFNSYAAKSVRADWKMYLGKNAPVNITISAVELETPTFFAPKFSLNFNGTLPHHQISLSADLEESSVALKLTGNYTGKTWSAKLQSWDWGEFHLPPQDVIQINVSLPDYTGGIPKVSSKIDAVLQANLSKLGFIGDLVPNIRVTAGKIAGKLHLTGSLDKPVISGSLDFLPGKILIPALNLSLTNASITSAAIGHVVNYTAHALSGKQEVFIEGATDFSQKGIPTTVKIRGNDILLIDTPEYTIYGSPNVTATIIGTTLDLKGDITETNGIIRPQDFRNITQLPTNEVTFIGKPKVVDESRWPITTNIRLIAGEQLLVDSFGIHGYLDGSLHLIQEPDQALLANGKVGIRNGFYRAYGQQLKISHGSFMQFTNSPITNPALSIEATRKVNASAGSQIQSFANEKITVGMNIHGPLNNPDINLFASSGNLSQSDILSYILTGGASSNGNPLTSSAGNTNGKGLFSYSANIMDAIKLGAGGVGNTTGLVSKIQSGLGFSELGFESDTTLDAIGNPLGNQTSFVLGRHLSKDLYIRYSRGVFGSWLSQQNKITLRYLFHKNWAIQLETAQLGNGSESGADILYTVEKK